MQMPNRAVIQAKKLSLLKQGPGAAIVPPSIKSIHVTFSRRNADGHMGARKFVQTNLPRISFHNPQIDIQVNKIRPKDTKNEGIPAKIEIHGLSENPTIMDVQHHHSDEICRQLLSKLKAVAVEEPKQSSSILP